MRLSMSVFALILLAVSFAAAQSGTGKVFVVRHAEKVSDAQDTPLSDAGRARAECLAQTLKDANITAVLTTQYVRTKQTAQPTLKQSHAHEESFDAKALPQIIASAKEAAKNGNVLIVGHSNTIPQLMTSFGTPAITIPDTSYDQLFIFTAANPKQLTIVHYCPALPADKTQHAPNSMAK